jgi:hypothetical protein
MFLKVDKSIGARSYIFTSPGTEEGRTLFGGPKVKVVSAPFFASKTV